MMTRATTYPALWIFLGDAGSVRCMLHSREIPMARTAEVDSEGAPQHVEEKLSNIEVTRSPCLFP